MSAEFNKVLCAILSAILVLLLSSFISELLYQADTKNKKISYLIEEEIMNDKIEEKVIEKIEKFTFDDIQKLLTKADIVAGEKFATKNCSVCHDFNLPIKNKIGPSLANVVNREIAAIEGYKYSKALKNINQKWTLENLYLFLDV